MASIPGAVFKAGKIHDEISRFRKRSASDAAERKPFDDVDAEFRGRSVSMTSPPTSQPSTPMAGVSPTTSGLSPAISGESIRNFVGGFISTINGLRPKNVVDTSLESVNDDFPAMRNYPNAGSIADLVHMK